MEPKLGQIYRHFKGSHYRVISIARHSENWDQKLVIYESIEAPKETHARPIEMWTEIVEKPEYNNYNGPRFIKINSEDMKSNNLQGVLFELTLIFLVISNFAIFQMAEVGSYGYIFKIISVVLLAVLVLHLGFKLASK